MKNSARGPRLWVHFTPGNTRVTVGAEVSEPTQGGSEATASGAADTGRQARLQHYLHIPEELANRNRSPEQRLTGGYLGSGASQCA